MTPPRPARPDAAPDAAVPAGDGDAEEDVRTLWVTWNAQGDRFKDWRIVMKECHSHRFSEAPLDLEGQPTALQTARTMERQGGDPRRRHEMFGYGRRVFWSLGSNLRVR